MLDEYLSVQSGHMLVENTRALGYLVFTDLATDREIVFHHGVPTEARRINPRRTQRTLDFALEGKAGFFFEQLSEDAYRAFNELFDKLAQ